MQIASALGIGLIFGLGIIISGMSNLAKVLNFFDVAGHWDPSLAFVMGGALVVTACGYRLALRLPKPVLGEQFALPTSRAIDVPLIAGAAVFGLGWGLIGFCPGGLLPAVAIGRIEPVVAFLGLMAGLAAARYVRLRGLSRLPAGAVQNR